MIKSPDMKQHKEDGAIQFSEMQAKGKQDLKLEKQARFIVKEIHYKPVHR